MITWRSCSTLLAIALLVGCPQPLTIYFPAESGLSWDYRVTRTGITGKTSTGRILLQNDRVISEDGQRYLVQRTAAGEPVRYLLADDGIYWLDGEGMPRPHLGLPAEPERVWQQTINLHTLDIFGPAYLTTERLETRFLLTFRIIETDGRVTVPAGRFDNCLVASGRGHVAVDRREFLGVDVIHAEETRWYAPGVGLVKRERREYTEPGKFDGRLVQALVRFSDG